MTNSTDYRDAIDAFDLIDRITRCDCPDPTPRNRFCLHFHAATALRDLLIDRDATPSPAMPNDPFPLNPPDFLYHTLRSLLKLIDTADYTTDRMTAMLLDNSLCPLHAIDYAICFDDDDDECAQIRTIHPSHDT